MRETHGTEGGSDNRPNPLAIYTALVLAGCSGPRALALAWVYG